MKQLCPHDTLAVYIRREDRLEAQYATGLDCLQVGAAIVPWGEGICGRAAATATALLNVDPLDHPDRPSVGGATSLRSALAIPLEGFSGVAGVLCLYAREKNAFTEDHLRILSAAATKVAVAVENALKYRQVERSAVTDMLTELPNARSLFLHLDSELSRAQRTGQTIAVLVCDLDGFKQINDRFGHLEGNRVLRAVARGLRAHCREYDTVARLGGDEFVLVLPGQEPESVSVKVEQLIRAVAEAGYETDARGLRWESAWEWRIIRPMGKMPRPCWRLRISACIAKSSGAGPREARALRASWLRARKTSTTKRTQEVVESKGSSIFGMQVSFRRSVRAGAKRVSVRGYGPDRCGEGESKF